MQHCHAQEREQQPLGCKPPYAKGYECIKILIAIFLAILKGLIMYSDGVALKRYIVFPLFTTINVCRVKRGQETQETQEDMGGGRRTEGGEGERERGERKEATVRVSCNSHIQYTAQQSQIEEKKHLRNHTYLFNIGE